MSAFTIQDAEKAKIQLIADGSKGSQAVHDLVVAYQANRRSGTAQAKTRGEVRGTGKKMYRQKGTGGARHGDRKAPIFVGGGVAFGPRNRSYAKTVSRKVRTLALRRVLGEKINEGVVHSVKSFEVASGKTKDIVTAIREITDAARVIVVGKSFSEETYRAERNLTWALLQTAENVNVEELLFWGDVIIVDDALETLAQRTA
ncbi:MAG: 50S ribosomal protein L4 [Verrucomicrobiaceae bacterium TMED137]|jgi:large subunit ribosomal protein L4|nr:MAG: 50S ribosomal protein L4 [Verrucomicrobiaceae bacterium TMED137]RZN89941.1 MAG: 50S ribosomal protein L4 [Verrucomicrobiaceae bacterium]HAE19093.1 50S ribosomal protein L4 [Verrucomicrobiales bacterium]HCN80645.1 50S ribosomal protein L4 [Verrucomicrobiales bacterium]|tara:strand:+ start:219 stop:824 length:606 start_codon:yes stop_codon:yes gene_type:complete